MLKDYRLLPKAAPKSLVILLHGVGANGQDLIGLADTWQHAFPHTAFVSPDAADPYDQAPFGRQWFSLRDWGPDTILAGVKKAHPVLENYIGALLAEFSLPASRCVLLGFSQGTMMSLYTGLRYPEPLAGILGYSGALIGIETLERKNTATPICLVHGREDDVVPAQASALSAEKLRELGYDVWLELIPGIGHGIDERGLEKGAAFLQRTLKEA